ncbi:MULTISPECIES: tRNA (N6-threonylcarbamoyladenosine(37)-N6)-methyltransferase TrmO [unclassified Acinetobacter]|uniref:tRNA (N6-threonylcarbamoyladenosine(37)-N6)-methyltransferase TrmO n=1 Tax=unclassified Acinetobacter TaxID=196816 RepID=UPI0035BB9CDF
MKENLNLPIIGYMHSDFVEKFGIPRQPNLVDTISYIVLNQTYADERAFVGIEQFSHLWLLWHFHDNKNQANEKVNHAPFRPMIRPPRLGGNQKIGVFASRSMYRPSPIGLSVVKFLRVEKVANELRLYVSGADLLHGTPILDIKPYIAYSDAIFDAKSGYAQQAPDLLKVFWHSDAIQQRQQFSDLTIEKIQQIEHILALDPRPAYHDDDHKVYGLAFAQWNIRFQIQQGQVLILAITISDN